MKNKIIKISLVLSILFGYESGLSAAMCEGRFVNPISDVCWSCMFPLTIGSMPLVQASGGLQDTQNPGMPLCLCAAPPPLFFRIGLSLGYWEPSSMTDVTRSPFCMVNMGMSLDMGYKMQEIGYSQGASHNYTNPNPSSFYWVHWYKYPLISWLELLTDVGCLETGGFDLAYFAEVDPMWDDDLLAFILNPEAILFGNPATQLACSIDALAAMAGMPLDDLFWCAGSQGSLYPFTGNVGTRASSVSNAVLLTERMNAKMHRLGMILESSPTGLCFAHYSPILPKSRYRYQFTNPVPSMCSAYGKTTIFDNDTLQNGFSAKENFGLLNFRKRNCCFL